jgi:glycosyltransferase involved in cell wall biosynthesis
MENLKAKQTDIDISIVIPVYNSETILEKLILEIETVFKDKSLSYELVLVNDGSKDNSWEKLKELVQKHKYLTVINLLKNYGQHNAIFCGFHYTRGNYVVTMDDDLQNPPSEISKLYEKINEGYDVVFGRFIRKQHAGVRKLGTKIVGYLNTKIFDKPSDIKLTNFRIIRKEVIQRIIQYKTTYPYIPGLVILFSERIGNTLVEHKKRSEGKSNYTLMRILKLVGSILFNYSSFPIRIVSMIGFFIALLSFIVGIMYILRNLIVGIEVQGWTTLIVLISFLGGYIILMLGMLGEYIGRMNKQMSSSKSYTISDIKKSDE